jgi:hypothetical protein
MSTATAENFRFDFDWEPGEGVQSPELAETWARLSVWVDDRCVTHVEDVENGSSRRSIYAAMYPLAEWIAFNWWQLRANVRPAAIGSELFSRLDTPWLRRSIRTHNLRAAGDGYVWPNLTVLPEGPATRLVWHPDNQLRAGAPIRYLGAGEALVDSFSIERAFADFVEAVMTRLRERGIDGLPLQEEWDAVTSASQDEVEFCLAAARLGLDPYSLPSGVADALQEADAVLDDDLLNDFLEAVVPSRIVDALDWVSRGDLAISQSSSGPSETLRALRGANLLRSDKAMPWDRGWEQADAVRDFLGLAPTDRFDTSDSFRVIRRASEETHLQALGGLTPDGGGALVIGRKYKPRDQRFGQARALWNVLRSETPRRFLLTSSSSFRPRVERAFAAELLAPAAGLRELVAREDGAVVTTAELEDAADHFAVSPFLVRHQVENQLAMAVAA